MKKRIHAKDVLVRKPKVIGACIEWRGNKGFYTEACETMNACVRAIQVSIAGAVQFFIAKNRPMNRGTPLTTDTLTIEALLINSWQ